MKKTLNDLQKLAEHVFEVSEESDKYALIVLGCPSGGNQATFEIYEPRKGHENDLSNTFTVDMIDGWEDELYKIVEEHLVDFYCYEPKASPALPENCRLVSVEEARELYANSGALFVHDGYLAQRHSEPPQPVHGTSWVKVGYELSEGGMRRSIFIEKKSAQDLLNELKELRSK